MGVAHGCQEEKSDDLELYYIPINGKWNIFNHKNVVVVHIPTWYKVKK